MPWLFGLDCVSEDDTSLRTSIYSLRRRKAETVPRKVPLRTGSGGLPLASCTPVATWLKGPLAYDFSVFCGAPKCRTSPPTVRSTPVAERDSCVRSRFRLCAVGKLFQRSMPFWSLMSRAERIVASVDAYKEFARVSISLNEWRSTWLPGLKADEIFVGLNWSGDRATGYDVSPTDVLDSLSARDSTSLSTEKASAQAGGCYASQWASVARAVWCAGRKRSGVVHM